MKMGTKVYEIRFIQNGREYWTRLRETTAEIAVGLFKKWNKDVEVISVEEVDV